MVGVRVRVEVWVRVSGNTFKYIISVKYTKPVIYGILYSLGPKISQ